MTDLPGVAGGTLSGVLSGAGALTGQVLGGVSATESDVITHVTTAGETLADVAQTHGADPQAVLDANPQLPSTELPEGVRVTVPVGTPPQDNTSSTDAPSIVSNSQDMTTETRSASLGADPSDVAEAASSQNSLPSGGGDWRLVAQAASPATAASPADASEQADEAGVPTASPAQVALAAGDTQDVPPGLASLFGEAVSEAQGRLPPELQTAVPLGLAAALSTLGFVAVDATQARPGDVVILLREDGLHAEVVPPQGAQALGLEPEDSNPSFTTLATDSAVLLRRPDTPQGFDAPSLLHRRRRRRRRSPGALAPDPRRAWLERLLPVAEWIKARWGVPIALTVAHATLVSDWGRHAPGNDYFGMRAARRAGADATPPRNGRRDPDLETYASLEDAADDLGAVLAGTIRARAASSRNLLTFIEAAEEIGDFGARYRERLICTVELNNLSHLDHEHT